MRALALVLLLAACTDRTPPVAVCPVVIDLPKPMQARIADEAEALPPDSYLFNFVLPDYVRMRDEARAICGYERMEARE